MAATPASAQTTISTFTVQAAGTVVGSLGAALTNSTTPENVSCSGNVTLRTTAVTDPALPPGVVVSIDARSLSCTGLSTGMVYVNSGQANLTRLLVAADVIKTTFAFYPSGLGGFLKARTALLTLNLTYNTTNGALTAATGSIGNL